MKTLLALLILLSTQTAFSQITPDSLQSFTQGELPFMPDSLKRTWNHVDSVRHCFNLEADSLQTSYIGSIQRIDEMEAKIRNRIDSLAALDIPAGQHFEKLDSLNKKRHEAKQNLDAKLDKLKSKTIGKLDKVEMTPGMEGPVGEFSQKVNSFTITDQQFMAIPAVEVPGFKTPSALGSMPQGAQFKDLGKSLENFGQINMPTGALDDQLGSINDGNFNLSGASDAVEQQASTMAGLDHLSTASESLTEINAIKEPDALASKGAEVIAEQTVDHFAGKEEALQSAMEAVSKYKARYSSVSGLKDVAKRPPNPMKGLPFVERLVPGIYLQLIKHRIWLFDVNPYVGYRISGRFTAGAGWNQRYAYETNSKQWVPQKKIFGPRVYVDFAVWKNYTLHLESEYMNTFVPNNTIANNHEVKRSWVSSTMVGLKKKYTLYKALSGTVLIQYNLYDRHFQSPYMDRINARMGFEYALRKKEKSLKETASGSTP